MRRLPDIDSCARAGSGGKPKWHTQRHRTFISDGHVLSLCAHGFCSTDATRGEGACDGCQISTAVPPYQQLTASLVEFRSRGHLGTVSALMDTPVTSETKFESS